MKRESVKNLNIDAANRRDALRITETINRMVNRIKKADPAAGELAKQLGNNVKHLSKHITLILSATTDDEE